MTRAGWIRLLVALLVAALGPWVTATASSAEAVPAYKPVYYAGVALTAFRFSPAAAGALNQDHVVLYADGSAYAFVTTTVVTHRLIFYVTADLCEGAPILGVAVDGVTYLTREIDGAGTYAAVGTWSPGRHQVTFRFANDHHTATCDRNLRIGSPDLVGYEDGSVWTADVSQGSTSVSGIDPASAGQSPGYGQAVVTDAGTVSYRQDSQGASELHVTMVYDSCLGAAAHVRLAVDGAAVFDGPVEGAATDDNFGSVFPGSWANGVHTVTFAFSDLASTADCDVYLFGPAFWGKV